MKLLRFGQPGEEKPGVLDGEGAVRDLSALIEDIDSSVLSPAMLAKIAALDIKSLPVVGGTLRLGIPVKGTSKFIAIGLNYLDHAIEANMPVPTEPIVFLKAPSCLNGPNDDVMQPKHSTKLDWEVEIGMVIGKKAQYVSEEEALEYVAGYCVANDVSERNYQLERGGQWDKGKGFDTFGPIGPYLVTRDEVGDPQNLNMWLDVNGGRMQTGNTRTMIFNCAKIISYLSECMTLLPGDIVITGTPPGVGMGMKPPRFLQPGDVVTLGIEKLGEQRQRIVPYSGNR
jgi:2-keto-4-pentenoate hydratase/2-oxohepta-3-ene-1,7-dioic acid hydratase in catechol pathway